MLIKAAVSFLCPSESIIVLGMTPNVSRHAGYTVAITGPTLPSLAALGKPWHLRAQRSVAQTSNPTHFGGISILGYLQARIGQDPAFQQAREPVPASNEQLVRMRRVSMSLIGS